MKYMRFHSLIYLPSLHDPQERFDRHGGVQDLRGERPSVLLFAPHHPGVVEDAPYYLLQRRRIRRVHEPAGVVVGDHGGDLREGGVYNGDPARQGDDRARHHRVLPLQVVLEEVYRDVYGREESLELRERHGAVRGHRLVLLQPFEVALGLVGARYASAPVPGQEEVEAHLGPLQLALDHVDPAPERAPRLQVAGDRELDPLADGAGFSGPVQGRAHVDDFEREPSDVTVGLEHPGQEVRDLLGPVHDEGVGKLYRPDLASPERGELFCRIPLSVLVERLQHLRGEEVQHVPDALYGLQVIHLIAVDKHGDGGRVRLEVGCQSPRADDLRVGRRRMGHRPAEPQPLAVREPARYHRLRLYAVGAQALGEPERPQTRRGDGHAEARNDVVREHEDPLAYHLFGTPSLETEMMPPLVMSSCGYRSDSTCSRTTCPFVASRSNPTNSSTDMGYTVACSDQRPTTKSSRKSSRPPGRATRHISESSVLLAGVGLWCITVTEKTRSKLSSS